MTEELPEHKNLLHTSSISSSWFSESTQNYRVWKVLSSALSGWKVTLQFMCEVTSWICNVFNRHTTCDKNFTLLQLCHPCFTWFSEVEVATKLWSACTWGMYILQITLDNTVLAEIFLFLSQDKIALIEVEEFENLSQAVASLSRQNVNQKKTVKTSNNYVTSL